jgi:hypothetical protein
MMNKRMLCVFSFAVIACTFGVEAEERAQGESRHTVGSTSFAILSPEGDVAGDPSASISFDKDIVVNGNGLPAGNYALDLHSVAGNDVHVVFSQHIGEEEGAKGKLKERLRLAVRFDEAPKVTGLQIGLELIEEKPRPKRKRKGGDDDEDDDDDGEQDRRRKPREPSATMTMHWGDHVAALTLQMTGWRWVGTPPPEVPTHLQMPWSLVFHSLNGLVEQSVDMHIEHFSDDFESDWHDGGSVEAQKQFFGWVGNGGGWEDSVLVLDQMKWTEDEGSVTFRNLKILAPRVQSFLEYTVKKRENGWKITYLYGPPESHV